MLSLRSASASLLTAMAGVVATVAFFLGTRRRKKHSVEDVRESHADQGGQSDSALGSYKKDGSKTLELRDRLTVVLTTSAVPSHPSTYLLDETLKSMSHALGLSQCSLLIVCDGFKLCPADMESKCRAGIINPDLADRYEKYKQQLRERRRSGEFELLELSERHGFGFAVRASLEQVRTPYMIVMQHDRSFLRDVNIEQLLDVMEQRPYINYLGMPTATTLHHQYHVLSKYCIRIEPEIVRPGLTITPLVQWYDSAHIARTDYYQNFVFGPKRLVARGGFIEDKLGQKQLHDIRTQGLAAHAEYGTYIFNDDVDQPVVLHLDGRDSRHLAHAH